MRRGDHGGDRVLAPPDLYFATGRTGQTASRQNVL